MSPKRPILAFNDEIHKPVKVSDAVASISSGTSVNSEDTPISDDSKLGVLKTSCVSGGCFIPSENKTILKSEYSRVKHSVEAGEVIVSRMNTPLLVGEVGYVASSYGNLFLPDRLWALKAQQNFSARWLTYYLTTPKIKFRLKELATGTSGSMKNISQPSFLGIQLHAPSPQEQQKIADFLTSVDTKISQLTEKHRLLKEYKQGVMQQIFSQQIRFKDEDGKAFPDWKTEAIGKYLEPYKELVPASTDLPILTSSRTGLYLQERSVINDGDYGVVPLGYFTYRHMSDDLIFKFNVNRNYTRGAISKEYPVFKTVGMDTYFLETKLNEGHEFKRFAIQQKQGGTRTRLYFKNLKELKLALPCLAEQQKIAQFLQSLDSKIDAVAEQIEQTKQFKKGLLQQMFV
ncbi:hypothetical protein C1N32_12735 [Vibrio diazotrophicus]|uniref:Type I restriction modification DNA specificity domain-containing protein n=1 Tax=Vibrio diazotrophicus TaxID=685 RepID=A0A2J8I1B6_VIBDI|nr:restriction endonuclease subunit S [Vibrio diazotrophicus]PNI04293.1 hypothetical protein C1N32_12735 [Vibrio diazotrophicus]